MGFEQCSRGLSAFRVIVRRIANAKKIETNCYFHVSSVLIWAGLSTFSLLFATFPPSSYLSFYFTFTSLLFFFSQGKPFFFYFFTLFFFSFLLFLLFFFFFLFRYLPPICHWPLALFLPPPLPPSIEL